MRFGKLNYKDCQSQSALCTICTAGHLCYSCSGGQFAYGSACVSTCPAGTYPSSPYCKRKSLFSEKSDLILACTNYNANCWTCDATSCLTCASGAGYGYGSSCVSSCPAGTYLSGGTCYCKKIWKIYF